MPDVPDLHYPSSFERVDMGLNFLPRGCNRYTGSNHRAVSSEAQVDFSVIIPVYNRAAAISKVLQSVSLAFPSGTEAILIDDGSTDATVSSALAQGPLLETRGISLDVLRLGHSGNVSKIRNEGAKRSTNNILVFLDSDVELCPNWGTRVGEFLEAHPGAGCVGGLVFAKEDPTQVYSSGSIFPRPLSRVLYILRPAKVNDRPYAVDVISNVFAVSRSTFGLVGGFNERIQFMGDETWLQLALRSRDYRSYIVPTATAIHPRGTDPKPDLVSTLDDRRTGAFLEPFVVQREFFSGFPYALCVTFNLWRLLSVEVLQFSLSVLRGDMKTASKRLRKSISLAGVVVRDSKRDLSNRQSGSSKVG